MIRLNAIIGGLRVDREGETKLVLEIPLNQMREAAQLTALLQQVMQVTFEPIKSGVIGGRAVDSQSDYA